MKSNQVTKVVLAALLCAVGILIPMYSPVKIILEPASFTLGSHIAIFIAMFISPFVGVSVALGTTLGFFLAAFPIVIVMRAASHLIFTMIGAVIINKKPGILLSKRKSAVFAFVISIIHALCEIAIVTPFYIGSSLTEAYYAKGFVPSVLLLVGVGTLIHSAVDYIFAHLIYKQLRSTSILKRMSHNN